MNIRAVILIIFIFLFNFTYAQRGKDGAKTITASNTIVNEYTSLTSDINAGATSISVVNSGLNSNNRFSGNCNAGDLIMIIQVQGASIESASQSKSWGKILNYNRCGLYEFAQVYSVPNATTIIVDCPLSNSYSVSGKTVIVRVPRYSTLTINNGGELTGETWNGTKGGILAVEILGNTIINSSGKINMNGKGFRGGAINDNNYAWGVGEYFSSSNDFGAEKGEGIAGDVNTYDLLGGRYCRGAPANGGGGANTHNHGGGGGANAGDTSLWTGTGNPDISNTSWVTAWNLEGANFANSTSTGGGRGGYSFSSNDEDALSIGPYDVTSNTAWGGDYRRWCGGLGGRPLDYSTGRIFMGGGGGAGEQNDSKGSAGANGGGIIFIQSYGNISGSGLITCNGAAAANSTSGSGLFGSGGADGAGGGGGGGAIIIQNTGNISGITASANGGNGGNQAIASAYNTDQAEGPGGGGGGGYIAISNGSITKTTNGGANGTTNASSLTEFTPNGATKGSAGINNAAINAFSITALDDTICSGSAATLTATLSGNPPSGITINWYDAVVGGNVLATGNTFTTPALTVNTTYYVGTCPGTYHQPVKIFIDSVNVNAGPDVTVCSGQSVTLNASGGVNYSWSPATGLSNTSISNPVANPSSVTVYTVIVTNANGCTASDDVTVNIGSSLSVSVTPLSSTICSGGNVQLLASGASSYTWSPTNGLSSTSGANVTASPTSTTTYIVNGSNASGCSGSTSVTISVNPIDATVSVTDENCGQSDGTATVSSTITCTQGYSYTWNSTPLQTTQTAVNLPSGTYTVTVSCGQCTTTAIATITNLAGPSVSVTNIINASCGQPDGSATVNAVGGTSPYIYNWSNGQSSSNLTNVNAGTYTVTVVDANNCTGMNTVNITSSIGPIITIDSVIDAYCSLSNGSVSISVTGGAQPYSYNWNSNPPQTSQNLSNVPSGNYTVTVSDSSGCSGTADVTVSQTTGLTLTTMLTDDECSQGNGSAIVSVFQGIGTYSYIWSTSPPQTDSIATGLYAGIYTVTVSDGACVATSSVTIGSTPGPTAQFTAHPNDVVIYDALVYFTDNSSGNIVSWQWDFGDGSSQVSGQSAEHTYNNTGTYYIALTVTDASGCTSTYTDTVRVNDIFVLYIPNTFTPNEDGKNDYFLPKGLNVSPDNFSMMIFDRWGNLIFKTKTLGEGWNGTYLNNGNIDDVVFDVYVYRISLKDIAGVKREYVGRVTLIP